MSTTTKREDYLKMVCTGSYPEVRHLDHRARARWFASYAETVVSRDIVALGDIRRASIPPRLLLLRPLTPLKR